MEKLGEMLNDQNLLYESDENLENRNRKIEIKKIAAVDFFFNVATFTSIYTRFLRDALTIF